MAAAHKDKDGVQMLFSSKSGGKEYYLSDAREKDRRRTQANLRTTHPSRRF
jgi:hypothetical protein